MSIKNMSLVWANSAQAGTALLMMLALADHANDDGACWPSIETLARRCRCSARQAQRILRDLEAAGEIRSEIGTGRGHTTLYYLVAPVAPVAPVAVGDGPEPEKGDAGVTVSPPKGDTYVTLSEPKKGDIQGLKGDIQRERVTSSARKGDMAVSPEPSLTIIKNRQLTEERERAPIAATATSPPDPKAKKPGGSEPALEPHPVYLLAVALAAVCGMDLAANKARLCKEAKILSGASPPATPELLARQYGCVEGAAQQSAWWWVSDWRGQKGEWPNPAAIRATWGQWAKATPQPKGGNHGTESGLTAIARSSPRPNTPTAEQRAEFERRKTEFAERHPSDGAV